MQRKWAHTELALYRELLKDHVLLDASHFHQVLQKCTSERICPIKNELKDQLAAVQRKQESFFLWRTKTKERLQKKREQLIQELDDLVLLEEETVIPVGLLSDAAV